MNTEFSLTRQVFSECMAMADHAFESGIAVPSGVASRLQDTADDLKGLDKAARQTSEEDGPLAALDETRYIGTLASIHGQLADLVTPATPRTITLLGQHSHGSLLHFHGGVPLVHRLRTTALISLAMMIGFSLSEQVDGNPASFSLFSNSGMSLLLNYLFLLSAASLGACFSALFTANRYIKDGTFDDRFESTYWSRYVLGLIGGIMIAMLVPIGEFLAPETGATQGASHAHMGPPLLALLGGFAANFVYRVLDRLVKMMESGVKGDPNDALAVQEQQVRARLDNKAVQDRLDQARQLLQLQQRLAETNDPEVVKNALLEMQQKLVEDRDMTGSDHKRDFTG